MSEEAHANYVRPPGGGIHEIVDYVILVVPPETDPHDPEIRDRLVDAANAAIYSQYHPGSRPKAVLLNEPEWSICLTEEDVIMAPPAHQCEQCGSGNIKARQFLRENPNEAVAIANLFYVEIWA